MRERALPLFRGPSGGILFGFGITAPWSLKPSR